MPTLRVQIVAALGVIVVLATALTGSLAVLISYRALKQQKQQDELAIARNVALQVDDDLAKARQAVEALARHPVFASMDGARQREALTLVTKVTELIDGIAAVHPSGRVIAIDGAEPATDGLLPAEVHRYLLSRALKGSGPHFSEVFRNAAGDPLVAVNVPMREAGVLRGVLSGIILLKNHSLGGIEDIRIGKTGYAYLVDEDGTVLVHPQRRPMQNLRDHPPVKALRSSGEGVIEFINQEGVPVLAAFAPIGSTGWGVVVRQPASESYAAAQRLLAVLTTVFTASLLAALGLGFRLARRIALPISDLVRGVQRISDGDLEARLPAGGSQEIAELAAAFNEMACQLQRRLSEIKAAHGRAIGAERRLARSQKLAAVGQLAAGLAHEINNPLNVISGFCELLVARTPKDDPRREHLDEILRECLRCQRLVRDLVDFARPREPLKKEIDLARLAGETAGLVSTRARSQGVDVRLDLRPTRAVTGDPDQLKQLLLNLYFNGIQAMPDGGVLSVSAGARDDEAFVEVADDGVGIPEDSLTQIFDPFFTTKSQGAGLGLAVCQSIVEAHGGTISVASRPGEGARFTVRLPMLKVEEQHVPA